MNVRAPQSNNVVIQSLTQIGNCGLFLLTLLAAIPRSFRYVRETIRQLWFVGAMSLAIIMVCGLFVGIFDAHSGTLAYANCGHEAAYVRRAGELERLAPTSSIVGIDPIATFVTATTHIGARETLVLATDGLTEARDPQRKFLDMREIERWIATAPDATPQELVDNLATRVRRWSLAGSRHAALGGRRERASTPGARSFEVSPL